MQIQGTLRSLRNVGAITALSLSLIATASAQDGYRVTQQTANTADSGGDSGPVRMGRIAYIDGTVSWRTDANSGWSTATTNLPLRQGAEVWVGSGSRAEIQFDDGSRLRLGNGTVCTLQTMYSDTKGEFTELKMNTGLASLTLVNKLSNYQIDTPLTSVTSIGPAYIRVGIDSHVQVACRRGTARIEGSQGSAPLRAGEYADVSSSTAPLQIASAPPADNWDQFNDNRDAIYDAPQPYVPSSVGIMSGNLSSYGSWDPDPHYGHLWHPHGMYAGWRPYHDGHWVWVDPFGWTWVGNEPWGWAPYHYGSWVYGNGGWGWAPGPAVQYWSPAVVSFSVYNGAVAWVPLAPFEVMYPAAISFGFTSGNWSFGFAIGGAAAYFGGGPGYVIGRPWTNGYVNRSYDGYNASRINGFYGRPSFAVNASFHPAYGANAYAITRTTTAGFAGSGRFQSGTASDPAIFKRGQAVAAGRGASPVFGPAGVRPTAAAYTANRSFGASHPSASVLSRPVYRAPIAAVAARTSAPIGRTIAPSSRPAQVVRGPAAGSPARAGTAGRAAATSKYARPANTTRANPSAAQSKYARTNAARTNEAARVNAVRTNTAARANTARTNSAARANTARTNAAARANTARTETAARANTARTNNAARANTARTNNAARANTARTNNAARVNTARVSRPAARTRSNGGGQAPQTRSSAPMRVVSHPRQARPPVQRSAPPMRQTPPPMRQSRPPVQRSAPPARGGGNDKRRGGG